MSASIILQCYSYRNRYDIFSWTTGTAIRTTGSFMNGRLHETAKTLPIKVPLSPKCAYLFVRARFAYM